MSTTTNRNGLLLASQDAVVRYAEDEYFNKMQGAIQDNELVMRLYNEAAICADAIDEDVTIEQVARRVGRAFAALMGEYL